MSVHTPKAADPFRRRGFGLALLFAICGLCIAACLDRPLGLTEPGTTNIFVDTISRRKLARIDLLFMIDNSSSMSDKQAILRTAVPDLVNRLVNPICIDASGNQYPAPPPGQDCELGKVREFQAVADINIAIVSSSLGDSGANTSCDAGDAIDLAHTMGSLPRGSGMGANDQGFLEWRPGGDVADLVSRFQSMVAAVGERGCGFEASLESWYRFLVDPMPYRELVRAQCPGGGPAEACVTPLTDESGAIMQDEELLAQRRAFLRDDSLLAIIMLSDENDCSIQARGQYWVVAVPNANEPMYRGSSACEADPNDPCCYSCPLRPPAGCEADPACDADDGRLEDRLASAADGHNLRCFDQKRRFGFDFLYPTARYVNALTRTSLCLERPDLDSSECAPEGLVPNPLFASGLRSPDTVYLGGIVGVPWQAIASDVGSTGEPLGPDELRFKTFFELSTADWENVLGVPGVSPPADPFMIESTGARGGVEASNPINGREYDTAQGSGQEDDLQYACIFPLPEPRDCTSAGADTFCDCMEGELDKPLCEPEPGIDAPGGLQHWAKAYPGLRQLSVLRDYGRLSGNSVVASICARNVRDDQLPDFGYRPAVASIIDRLKERLGNRCLPRKLDPRRDGSVACTLVEVRFGESSCSCDNARARVDLDGKLSSVIQEQLLSGFSEYCGPDDPTCESACACEVEQLRDPGQRLSCQNSRDAVGVEGWCYIADTLDQSVGNPMLVSACPATERRMLRFVGEGLVEDSLTFVACSGASFNP